MINHFDPIEDEILCAGKARNPHKTEGIELDKVTRVLGCFGYKHHLSKGIVKLAYV